jgi:hypothetical protein
VIDQIANRATAVAVDSPRLHNGETGSVSRPRHKGSGVHHTDRLWAPIESLPNPLSGRLIDPFAAIRSAQTQTFAISSPNPQVL